MTRQIEAMAGIVRRAALSLRCAVESYPFGPAMTVFRLFDDSGAVFAMFDQGGGQLFVRVSEDIHDAAREIEGMVPRKFWKNWVSLDLAVHQDPADIVSYINESWLEVAERRTCADRERLGLEA